MGLLAFDIRMEVEDDLGGHSESDVSYEMNTLMTTRCISFLVNGKLS